MRVFEKGLGEERNGSLKMMMVSQSFLCSFILLNCIILPYCPGTDLVGS